MDSSIENQPDQASWPGIQKRFWNDTAGYYVGLYQDPWSRREDSQVQEHLRQILPAGCTILDLGCGTGLALSLAKGVTTVGEYWGLDISENMIEHARTCHPNGKFVVQDMAELDGLPGDHFDAVLALFTTLSYSSDPLQTLRGAYASLRPGGRLLVSALSRYSLRRIVTGKFRRIEAYGTRGLGGTEAPSAHTFTPRQLREMAVTAGFTRPEVWGQTVLSGVMEWPSLWGASRQLSGVIPGLAHNLYLEAVKPVL